MRVALTADHFEPYLEVQKFQDQNLEKGKHGGVVTFVGTMRDFNDGQDVTSMFLDYYPGMTEKHIEQVCQEAAEKWEINDCYVLHRHGEIKPDEAIVLVAVWSAHRANAFDACRYIINYLKERAPFWKSETTTSGEKIWVEHNTEDPGVKEAEKRLKASA